MRLSELLGHEPELRSFAPHEAIPSTRMAGIEVEVENAERVVESRLWRIVSDSSLRNHGVELVLRQPLAGKDLHDAFDQLREIFIAAPAVHASERTSVHVHIDVRNYTVANLRSLLIAYIGCEAALYNLGGKERYDNIYCPGATAALEQSTVMRKLLHGNERDVREVIHRWEKYTGINLRSAAQRGSVEFRAHEGTVDVDRIAQWVCILLKLADYAAGVKNYNAVVTHLQEGPDAFVSRVFGDDLAKVLLEDGVYHTFYKNNMINVVDLLEAKEHKPKRKPNAAGSTDVDSILAELEAAVLAAGGA